MEKEERKQKIEELSKKMKEVNSKIKEGTDTVIVAGSFSEKLYRLFEYKKCKTQFVGLACCLEKMSSKSIVYSVSLQRKKEKGMLNNLMFLTFLIYAV